MSFKWVHIEIVRIFTESIDHTIIIKLGYGLVHTVDEGVLFLCIYLSKGIQINLESEYYDFYSHQILVQLSRLQLNVTPSSICWTL